MQSGVDDAIESTPLDRIEARTLALEPMIASESSDPAAQLENAGASESAPVVHAAQFHGDPREYFRIWIVNVALTIATLGVYAAWAKVRTMRYFHGNTRIAGAAFEYHAKPTQILRGRLVAFALLGSYFATVQFLPTFEPLALLLLFVLSPVLIVQGLRFRARYSSWRGLRFGFRGGYGGAYRAYFLGYLLSMLSFGLYYPRAVMLQKQYVVDHHRYGGTSFSFDAMISDYYAPYAIAFLLSLASGAFVIFVPMLVAVAVADGGEQVSTVLVYGMVGGFYLAMFGLGVYTRTRVANLTWASSRLGRHAFESTLRVREMLKLYVTNTLAIVATVGLAIPWAKIRTARYRAENFFVIADGDLDAFVADARAEADALGAEVADVFDVDIAA